jgi:hypothetical protein
MDVSIDSAETDEEYMCDARSHPFPHDPTDDDAGYGGGGGGFVAGTSPGAGGGGGGGGGGPVS